MSWRPSGPLLDVGIFEAVESVTLHLGGVLVDGQDFGMAPVAITRSSLWLSAIGRPDRWRSCTLVGFGGGYGPDPWLRAQREEVRPVDGYGRTEAVCRRVYFPEPTRRPEAWRRAVFRLLHAYRHVHTRSGCRDPYLRCALDARPDGRLRVLVCGW